VAVVTITDVVAPTIICQNITKTLDATGNVSMTAAEIDNGSNDACGIASVAASQTAFDCTHVGTNNVTLTVTDNNGNVSTCVAIVTIIDTIAPTVECQISHNEYLNGNCEFSIPDYIFTTTISDNCTQTGDFITTQIPAAGTILNYAGTTQQITIIAQDENENIDSCSFTITLVDDISPSISCPDNQRVRTEYSCIYEIADYIDMATMGMDNCDSNNVIITQSPEAGTMVTAERNYGMDTLGQTIVTITIEDQSGNLEYCDFVIDVTCLTDLFLPQFISPNGDGDNDLLIINGLEIYPKNSIVIFNRWGELVFEASPYLNDWDGTSNRALFGNDLPNGSYFYKFRSAPYEEIQTGYIVIKR